ncbi:sulfur carrier protein [Allonocardiopsis opalescens]|uniref:Sulfur carrier protein n=2 Tax=Allonocardiopsis opalescens TaxID=1144618 RepID=A0A2T0PZP6_9ACTN|nr:sulfur carrier protein [Allonocardiopsis opalescens]
MRPMRVTVNGETREIDAGSSVAEVVALLTSAPSGVAVALNGEVVSRGAWERTPLASGDRVDVLTAVQGG